MFVKFETDEGFIHIEEFKKFTTGVVDAKRYTEINGMCARSKYHENYINALEDAIISKSPIVDLTPEGMKVL